MRITYRRLRVLEAIAGAPGSPSSAVAHDAGINNAGQVSKLLARLRDAGLVEDASQAHGRGQAKRWRLTALGEGVWRELRGSEGP